MSKYSVFVAVVSLAFSSFAVPVMAGTTDLRVATPLKRVGPITNALKLPDLVIRAAAIRPTGDCRPGAPVLNVTVRVQNVGKAPSAAKMGVGMVQARDASGVNWGNGHGLPALMPGQTTSVSFPIYYPQSNPAQMQGAHTFKLTVNAGKWIRESNYANNGFRPVNVPSGLCGLKPDITSHHGPRIGGKVVSWGGSVTLGRKNAKRVQNGTCVFDFVYQMSNDGKADTTPLFVNRLRESRTLAAVNSGLSLKAGETKTLDTEPTMPVGHYTISVSLDDGNAVAESNENNNLFRVIVNVDNSCSTGRPAASLLMPKIKVNRASYPPSPCVGDKCQQASPKLNPQPEPPSPKHRLSLPAVQ